MDKAETLRLCSKGKDEWNSWAEQQLAKREDTPDWNKSARCDFSEHEFKDETDFSGFIFPGDARFRRARFRKTARFKGARFEGETTFVEAVFGGVIDFRNASFGSDFSIAGATLDKGPLTLEGAKFRRKSDFRSVEGSVALFMEGADFDQLPDFHGAAFRTPRLDNVTLRTPFTRKSAYARGNHDPRPWYLRNMRVAVDADVHAKFRILKKMAVEGHDRDRELEFAAEEVRARRFWIDHPHRWEAVRFWLGRGL